MTETPRSPDNPDNLSERPDVADADAPDGPTTDTVGDPATSPQTPPDVTPVDDDGQTADDAPADPVADATDEEAAAAGQVVIREYEQQLTEASAAGDADRIAAIQAEYNDARLKTVREADDGE